MATAPTRVTVSLAAELDGFYFSLYTLESAVRENSNNLQDHQELSPSMRSAFVCLYLDVAIQAWLFQILFSVSVVQSQYDS